MSYQEIQEQIRRDEETQAEEIEVPDAFRVHDERSAEWVLRKIREAREADERAQKWANEIARQSQKREERLMARFGVELQQYAQSQLEGAKKKSFALPSGTLGFRLSAAKIEVTDDTIYQSWCDTHLPTSTRIRFLADVTPLTMVQRIKLSAALSEIGVLPEVETSVSKSVVNEHFKTTGEIPDGCEYVAPEEKFYVK